MKRFFSFILLITTLSVEAGITIGAYNIRNFDYDERSRVRTNKSVLADILTNLNADVLSVEEINNTQEFEKFLSSRMPGYDVELTRCGGAHGQKLGFIYNTRTIELEAFTEDLRVVEPGRPGSCDSGSRPLAIGLFKIKATGQKFFGMTAHLKSGSQSGSINKRAAQFEMIKKIIEELKARTGVKDYYIAGDLNTTEFVKKGADYHNLNKVVSSLGMINLSSNLPCTAYYWGGTDDGIETPSMLDHLIVTPGLLKTRNRAQIHGHCQKVSCREVPIRELGVIYESVSDHCPMTATIQ